MELEGNLLDHLLRRPIAPIVHLSTESFSLDGLKLLCIIDSRLEEYGISGEIFAFPKLSEQLLRFHTYNSFVYFQYNLSKDLHLNKEILKCHRCEFIAPYALTLTHMSICHNMHTAVALCMWCEKQSLQTHVDNHNLSQCYKKYLETHNFSTITYPNVIFKFYEILHKIAKDLNVIVTRSKHFKNCKRSQIKFDYIPVDENDDSLCNRIVIFNTLNHQKLFDNTALNRMHNEAMNRIYPNSMLKYVDSASTSILKDQLPLNTIDVTNRNHPPETNGNILTEPNSQRETPVILPYDPSVNARNDTRTTLGTTPSEQKGFSNVSMVLPNLPHPVITRPFYNVQPPIFNQSIIKRNTPTFTQLVRHNVPPNNIPSNNLPSNILPLNNLPSNILPLNNLLSNNDQANILNHNFPVQMTSQAAVPTIMQKIIQSSVPSVSNQRPIVIQNISQPSTAQSIPHDPKLQPQPVDVVQNKVPEKPLWLVNSNNEPKSNYRHLYSIYKIDTQSLKKKLLENQQKEQLIKQQFTSCNKQPSKDNYENVLLSTSPIAAFNAYAVQPLNYSQPNTSSASNKSIVDQNISSQLTSLSLTSNESTVPIIDLSSPPQTPSNDDQQSIVNNNICIQSTSQHNVSNETSLSTEFSPISSSKIPTCEYGFAYFISSCISNMENESVKKKAQLEIKNILKSANVKNGIAQTGKLSLKMSMTNCDTPSNTPDSTSTVKPLKTASGQLFSNYISFKLENIMHDLEQSAKVKENIRKCVYQYLTKDVYVTLKKKNRSEYFL